VRVIDLLILFFWTIFLSNVTLLFSFFVPDYLFLGYVFWIVAGVLAGTLIVDIKKIILLSVTSYVISAILMFVILSLPVFLGTLSYQILSDIVYSQNLKLVFSFTFPHMLLINIVSGVVGGYIGETLSASHP